MKVTAIRTVHLGAPADAQAKLDRNWTFVIVEADGGISGLGECTLSYMEGAVSAVVDRLGQILVGQDPTRVEHLWQQMYRRPFWRGGVVMSAAMSGIDQALWDIAGKNAGLPVYRMLGGPVRDRIRCYARADLTGTQLEQAVAVKKQGFTGFKLSPEPDYGTISEEELVASAIETARSVREAVGPEMALMMDFHGRLSPAGAVRCLSGLKPYNFLFAEELIPPDNVPAYAEVTAAVPETATATGERLYTRWGFRELIERRAVRIIQPDICYAGGISELRRIAAHAETHYMQVSPHNPNGPVAMAASIHLAAATPNFIILEHARKPPYFEKALRKPLVLRDGHFELPTAPGLGVELDEDFVRQHPMHVVPIASAWNPDGSVADV